MTSRDLGRIGFGSLMPYVVQDVLMVASPYDCFILEEDGRFSDHMFKQYAELDLSSPPHFDRVMTGAEAIKRLKKKHFDLIITTTHCVDMSPSQLAAKIHKFKEIPIVLLTYDRAEAKNWTRELKDRPSMHVFVWTGDPKLLVALVKIVEDLKNVAHDVKSHVRVILVVEDSPTDYSEFLPIMYQELLVQLKNLLPDGLNERDKHNRMRARPKILLSRTYEEAYRFLRAYKNNLLGVISDVRFPKGGSVKADAGLSFVRHARKVRPDMPVLLQSFDSHQQKNAEKLDVSFSDKSSSAFLKTICSFMKDYFGFGDFIFRNKEGVEVTRARGIQEMADKLHQVSADSLYFHAANNHISNWLFARSEFQLAMTIQPRNVDEFQDAEAVRHYLIEVFSEFIERRQRGRVSDFTTHANLLRRDFTRIGSGSMGGKARGIAFVSHMLADSGIHDKYPDIRIMVPRAAVICTDMFDQYIATNHLIEKIEQAQSDQDICRIFLVTPLDEPISGILKTIIEQVSYPLAVRSSSLLEDSTFQPLAGIYKTFMLPNCSESKEIRLEQLSRAIRLVVASSFFGKADAYLRAHNLRPEQEKMAVLIQRLIGHRYQDRFYPHFAGVAQSINYYPISYMEPDEGIASLALGLGRTVVEGEKALRISLAHPQIQPHFHNPTEALRTSQRKFYALDLSNADAMPSYDSGDLLQWLDLDAAEKDGTLAPVGATYSHENNVIYDTVYRPGARIVNFSGVLKHDLFPLTPLLTDILDVCKEGMGGPVEVEFAVALAKDGKPAEMAILELRPLISTEFDRQIDIDDNHPRRIAHGRALGNGVIQGIRDIVYLHPHIGSFAQSRELAQELEKINHQLTSARRPFLLIGPGRWGTSDPWLGVPVKWSQVSGARAIIELELPNMPIDPSQGTHFFHNLISLRVGYFTIKIGKKDNSIDLDWLEALPIQSQTMCIRHISLEQPLDVRIDGRCGSGVILRPE